MTEIKIALEFSRYPGGRYRSRGKYSGEEFRDDVLIPALEGDEELCVILDGTAGYGSSFLEEAFGGLIRAGINVELLKAKLRPVAENEDFETYVQEIWQYIDEAASRVKTA
ncbi:MAG: STAS-like domain-containing protein [Rhizobiaceae bacterium]|nr:STAS-like domain-containing protein [Rhizobiaceae bacterium]